MMFLSNSGKVDVGKESTATISIVSTPLESTVEEVLGLPTIEPKVGNLIGGVEATPLVLTEIKVVEMAWVVAPLMLLTIMEEVLVAKLLVLVLLAGLAIIKVTKEEGPIMACLPVIEAMVEALPTITKLLTGGVARETVSKSIGEIVGKEVVDACEVVELHGSITQRGSPSRNIPCSDSR